MNLNNWEKIAKDLGAIHEDGESGSSDMAGQAIGVLLGEDFQRDAVHYYIEQRPGSELLRHVLWKIKPFSAMEECYKIFKSNSDIQDKRDAINLLKVISDKRAIKWVPEFLNDEDEGIQNWGIEIIDQLLYEMMCEDNEIQNILNIGLNHKNQHVRKSAENILSIINSTD